MAITVSQLVGLVTIQGVDQGVAGLARMGVATDLTSKQLALLGVGAGVIAAGAFVLLGAKTSEMAGTFQQGVNRLKTGGGDIQDSFNSLGNAIKKVAVDSGVATGPLILAMYQIVSANQRGAQAYATLAAAAQGAQIEQANVVDVTKVLTTLQTNWGVTTYTATQYMSGLVQAVKQGKITLEDLSTAMSPILPIAKVLGISFKDVASAMSVQTNAGLDAARAATGLQAVFVNIENPTKKALKAMQEFGVNSVDVANMMKKSLPDAFQMLINAALKVGPAGSVPFNQAMADMVGGGTRTAKTIDALVQNMGAWRGNIAAIGDAMKSGSKNVDGWALAQSGLNIQVDKAKAAMEVLGINIGEKLLPYLTRFVSFITPLIAGFAQWITSSDGLARVLQNIGGVFSQVGTVAQVVAGFFRANILPVLQLIGGFLVATFVPVWNQLVAVWNTSILPSLKQLWAALQPLAPVLVMLGGIILGVVVVALGIFVGVIGGVLKALAGLLQGVATVLGGMVQFFTGAVQVISGIIRFFVDLATGNFKNLGKDLGTIWQGIVNMFSGMWNVIKGIFQGAWGAISGFVSGLVQGVIGFFGHLKDILVGHSIIPDIVNGILQWFGQLPGKLFSLAVQMIQGLINGIWSMAGNFASALGNMVHNAVGNIPGLGGILSGLHILGYEQGGPVLQTGLAMVHKGEYVIPAGGFPASRMPSSSGYGAGSAQPIYLQINGYTLARLLMPSIVANIRNNVGVTNL